MKQPHRTVRVKVPASTANLGPGFDVAGMALGLHNEFEVEIVPEDRSLLKITVSGEGQGRIPLGENNLVLRACRRVWSDAGWEVPGGIRIHIDNRIPAGRGLGSSASAIVGGLVAANEFLGDDRLSHRRLLEIATEVEGHPDNVAAALHGGVTLAVACGAQLIECVTMEAPRVRLVAGIPDFQLSTRVARKALPLRVNFEDAVFNVGRTAMLVAALGQNRLDLLKLAMDDRLHHPYRSRLVPGMEAAFDGAKRAGALGVALSGAGPTVLAFVPPDDDGTAVADALREAFSASGVPCRTALLEPDPHGAQVMPTRTVRMDMSTSWRLDG